MAKLIAFVFIVGLVYCSEDIGNPLGIELPPPEPGTSKLHVTWAFRGHIKSLFVDSIGCNGCDAYIGDTPCSASLPILCVIQLGFSRPPYDCPPNGEYYCGWSEGILKETRPVLGSSLLSQANMDNICKQHIGPMFKAVEHHMGKYKIGMSSTRYYYGTWKSASPPTLKGGWNLYGYGSLPSSKTQRYWVVVDDQPAHCWN